MAKQPGPSLRDQIKGTLAHEGRQLLGAVTERATRAIGDHMGDLTGRLVEVAEQKGGPRELAMAVGARKLAEGASPARAALSAGWAATKEKVKRAFGGGGGGGRKDKIKVTNIVETIDVGVPVRLAYDVWTQFTEFPSFMKKVENVDQNGDERLTWKAQVFWSHRSWESTIIEQVPDERIVWRSEGQKGSVDGTITFHELTPDLTRVLVVLEYHPKGFFEHTGNMWRAQGRRVRLELKHYVRHVMREVVVNPDEIQGWRGEIRDGEVVQDHEAALAAERDQNRGRRRGENDEHDGDEYDEHEYDEDEDEYDEDEYDEDDDGGDEGEQEEGEDEYEDYHDQDADEAVGRSDEPGAVSPPSGGRDRGARPAPVRRSGRRLGEPGRRRSGGRGGDR
ncbi:SRPBCC family protein [Plantactinospora siamensis]|uniref:SRPBCC family protein n=1 Tax=Plantactinospora siamensis TaxID=555372 RepID=A0ABV6NVU6_9ACTN